MTKSRSSYKFLKKRYQNIWEVIANKIHFFISPKILEKLKFNKIVTIFPEEISSFNYDRIVSRESISFWKKYNLSHPMVQFSISLGSSVDMFQKESGEIIFKLKTII
jgi:hypothetical protein